VIINPFYYLFYRLYKRQRTKFGVLESIVAASMVLCSLVFVNIFTLETLLEKLKIIPSNSINEEIVILFILILMISSVLFFYFHQRYKKIETIFENNKKVPFGLGWILLYIVLSFIFFFYVANLK
jgi:membrane protease YdiL (CAAX protease family)